MPEKVGFYVLCVRSVNDAGEVSPESAFAELQAGEWEDALARPPRCRRD